MTTLGELKRQVFSVLRDPQGQFILDENVQDWLNEAQVDLNARLRLIQDGFDSVWVEGNTSVTVPTDYVELIQLRIGDDAVAMVDKQNFDSWVEAGIEAQQPLGWYHAIEGVEYIRIWPTPATDTTFSMNYVRQPAELDDPNDEPEIPRQLHTKMVQYGRAHGMWQMGEMEHGDRYMQLYESGLPAPDTARVRKFGGGLSVKRDFTNWDREPGISHV